MTAPAAKLDLAKTNPHRCELCRWFAPWLQEPLLGICGVRRDCVDKWDTCKNFTEAPR